MQQNETILKLIASVQGITVMHSQFEQADADIRQNIELSLYLDPPDCILLTGDSGAGKSQLCKAIVKSFGASAMEHKALSATPVVAFYAELPSPVTVKAVVSTMLEKLGDPHPDYGTVKSMTRRLKKLAANSGLRVVFLDEFQHLFSADATRTQITRNNVRNWLKNLIGELGVPIVLVGMPECHQLIDEEDQLARRFQHRYTLQNIPFLAEDSGNSPFHVFMVSFAEQVAKHVGVKVPTFQSREEAVQAYALTRGNPGMVRTMFMKALMKGMAPNGASKELRLADIGTGFFAKIADDPIFLPKRMTEMNPFMMKESTIFTEIGPKLQ